MSDNAVWKAVKPYMNGGLSGMGATCIIQPLDSTFRSNSRRDKMIDDAPGNGVNIINIITVEISTENGKVDRIETKNRSG